MIWKGVHGRIKRLPEKLESTQAQVQKANAATATPYLLVLNGRITTK